MERPNKNEAGEEVLRQWAAECEAEEIEHLGKFIVREAVETDTQPEDWYFQ